MLLTRRLICAAAQDAARRHMRKHGRTAWNEDDWDVGAAEYARLLIYLHQHEARSTVVESRDNQP